MGLFWADSNLKPKFKSRFLVYLSGLLIPPSSVKSITKPGWSTTVTKVVEGTTSVSYDADSFEWTPVELVLVDTDDPDITKQVVSIMTRGPGVNDMTGNRPATLADLANHWGTLGDGAAMKKKIGIIRVVQIGEDINDIIEQWDLHDVIIQNADFGELSYDSDELSEVKLTLKYDYPRFLSRDIKK